MRVSLEVKDSGNVILRYLLIIRLGLGLGLKLGRPFGPSIPREGKRMVDLDEYVVSVEDID